MLYYLLFWALLGFIFHFYITFGTNLLTGGPAQICWFMPISVFRRKRNIKRSRNGTKSTGEVIFGRKATRWTWSARQEIREVLTRVGGRPTPLGAPPCLVGPSSLHRCTPCTHIYLRTQKLPEQNLDREFLRRKPPEPPKTNRYPVPASCRRGIPSPVAIFIIPALSMTRRE